ncbi:MAG: Crp/Fnr family transcriptional regulator [Pelosinus sp.]|nr:Crp/Fnr family transcriptional regulator [Pelosinus sp.]
MHFIADFLIKTPLFSNIGQTDLTNMLGCLDIKVKEYPKSHYIVSAGEPLSGIGILLSGEAAVIKENAAGSRIIMTILQPGGLFGEMPAFLPEAHWPASVYTQKSSSVLFLPPEKIVSGCQKLCPWHQTLTLNMLKIISEKALQLNKKVEYLSMKSMRGKLCAFFLEQYQKNANTTFTLPLKRNELADFLNVSRPSMSREMARMKEEGLIDFYLSSVRLLNIEKLRTMID